MLSVRNVAVRFGGIIALDGISFEMERGQILGLIGPNGAGKTTLFNCLSRLYTPSNGEILFEGRTILDRPSHRIAEIGIGRTFQNIALFRNLSVIDNIRIGVHSASNGNFLSDALHLPWSRRQERQIDDTAWRLLSTLDLTQVANAQAGNLPFGTQKRIELARALAMNPKLLLLDEPAGGLNHGEVGDLGDLLRRIRDEFKLTLLLVEHHMNLVMSVSDKVVVLNFGRKIAEGTPKDVQNNPMVIQAYLGTPTTPPASADHGSGNNGSATHAA